MVSQITDGIPRFGPVLNHVEHHRHLAGFASKMYGFIHRLDPQSEAGCINVLHLTTDTTGAAYRQMQRLVAFMDRFGYHCLQTEAPLSDSAELLRAGRDTDVIVVGSDSASTLSDRYILRSVVGTRWLGDGFSTGWFSITPYWDMLWYRTDTDSWNEPQPADERFAYPPHRAGRDFYLLATCMLHTHMLRRNDLFTLSGEHTFILEQLEWLCAGIIPGGMSDMGAKTRFEKLGKKISQDGCDMDSVDVHLLFAALDVLRSVRNILAHPQRRGGKLPDGFDSHTMLYKLAEEHDRPEVFPPDPAYNRLNHKYRRRLAHMVAAWLDEYHKSRS